MSIDTYLTVVVISIPVVMACLWCRPFIQRLFKRGTRDGAPRSSTTSASSWMSPKGVCHRKWPTMCLIPLHLMPLSGLASIEKATPRF
jgi:hypothetical protein